MKKNIPNKRRTSDEGHLSQLIRRKMIQKNHGDASKFNRNIKHKKDYGTESAD